MAAVVPAGLVREASGRAAPLWLHGMAAAALVGVAALAYASAPGAPPARALLAGLAATAVALAVIDLGWLLIPDLYVLAIAAPGLVGPLSPGLLAAAFGAVLAGGLLWAVGRLVGRGLGRDALGFGDVKLAAAIGCLLGPVGVLWTVCIASTLGVVAALLLRAAWRREAVPFGALLAPVGVAVLWVRQW